MITYEEILKTLKENSDKVYGKFNAKIAMISDEKSLGVRVPSLREIAKKIAKGGKDALDIICLFPDEYYEITFLKFLTLAYLKSDIDELISYLDKMLPQIYSWSICDCFTSTLKYIKKSRAEFLPYIKKCVNDKREFVQRFAYVCLLSHYTVPEYIDTELELMQRADCSKYYVHMAVAWLLAEILIKDYEKGIEFIKSGKLSSKTMNKGIQKARESFRLTEEQKNYLKSLKK